MIVSAHAASFVLEHGGVARPRRFRRVAGGPSSSDLPQLIADRQPPDASSRGRADGSGKGGRQRRYGGFSGSPGRDGEGRGNDVDPGLGRSRIDPDDLVIVEVP